MLQTFFGQALGAFMATSFGLGSIAMPFFNLELKVPQKPLVAGPGVSRFESCNALKNQISKAPGYGRTFMVEDLAVMPMAMGNSLQKSAPTAAVNQSAGAGQEYSSTNVQVQGVDEADIVKIGDTTSADGVRYIFHLTNNRLMISAVDPAEKAKLISEVKLEGLSAQDLYVQGDRLMVIGTKYEDRVYPMPLGASSIMPRMPWRGQSVTVTKVYDVSSPTAPKELRTVEFDGSINSSRMIGGIVYLVMNSWTPWEDLQILPGDKDLVPAYKDSVRGDDFQPMVKCGEVGYWDVQPSREYLSVASLSMSGTGEVKRSVVLGSGQTVYASTGNLYVARQDWSEPSIRDSLKPTESGERTNVYKFSLNAGDIAYRAKGTVPGHLLNQFSMDEYEGNLRVATTKGQAWDQKNPSTNNVYVLGADLKTRGSIQNIAPGETIYSVRFMGARGYMVTFKKVDPFFVFDLKDPEAPKILGKLKIPGYSDYLHPMDENHIIGVGKNAVDAAEQSFAWYQGMKMALFDVTDVSNPKEMYKTEIGDRGTDSPALNDHKAFLYSPEKQLLALPVRLAELSPEVKNDPNREGNEYGDFKFQGAYVYRLTLEKGFEFLGRVTHHDDDQAALKSGYYWGDWDTDIQRVLYVGNNLLTVSNGKLLLNGLYDLGLKATVQYPKAPEQPNEGPILY